MLFTEAEIKIAKNILKLGLYIFLIFIFSGYVFKMIDYIKYRDSPKNIKVNQVVKKNNESIENKISQNQNVIKELPLYLDIPEYNISTKVESPESTNVDILDNALSKAAVYYPGSGFPGSNNTLIFGHSTGFKVVINKAYQTFNNLKNVKPGTLIYIKTQSKIHVYKTKEVTRVSKYTSWIQFKSDNPMLTLATCDSFGKASDRWVLVADYVGVK